MSMSWELVDRAVSADYSSAADVLVAFAHWRALRCKLRCVGIGDDFAFGADDTLSELLPRGWNAEAGESKVYGVRYRVDGEREKKFLLKVIVDGDSAILNLVRVADEKTSTSTLVITDVVEENAVGGGEKKEWRVRRQEETAAKIDKELLEPLLKEGPKAKKDSPPVDPGDPLRVGPPRRPGQFPHHPHDPFANDPFGYGGSDLDPFGRGGGGGMIFDPPGLRGGRGGSGGFPGPRFDPVYPHMPNPGLGPMPGRGGRGGPRFPGGGRNFGDDLPPPGFHDDMFG